MHATPFFSFVCSYFCVESFALRDFFPETVHLKSVRVTDCQDAGLACKFVVAAKPADRPVTERAIPTTIFDAEPSVKVRNSPLIRGAIPG
eukprot:scaffold230930_cov33-Tisochrysis_lutea.AAC.9